MTRPVPASAEEVIRQARDRGVSLWVEGSRLRFRAPGGGLPADLREQIAPLREGVVSALRVEAAREVRLEPLAPNQFGIWHIQRLQPDTVAYNIAVAYRLRGLIDPEALDEAVQVLVDRHDVLRTDYPEVDGTATRRVVGYREAEVRRSASSAEALVEHLERCVKTPFPLDEGAPIAVHLVEADAEHALLIVAHHLALDGLSMRMAVRELTSVYGALLEGETPDTSYSGPRAYSEWIEAQEAWLSRSGGESARFWRDALDPPPPPLTLPLDRSKPNAGPGIGGTREIVLSRDTSDRLREICRSGGYSPFVGLLAAYVTFLRALSGADDVTVGTPVHGRSSARSAAILGHLVNVLPVRVRDTSKLSFLGLMDEIRNGFRAAAPHEDYPLARMTWDLKARDPHGGPPVQAFFALHDFRQFSELRAIADAGALETQEIFLNQLEGQFDLALDAFYEEERYRCCWRFDGDALDGDVVTRWAEVFRGLVEDLVDTPRSPVSAIGVRAEGDPGGERGPDVPIPRQGVLEVLERLTEQCPHAPAIEAPDGTYDRQELLDMARAVASDLGRAGVQAGDLVGVAVERSRDLVAALLGVMGAGAAFVPLDPRHPAARLRGMLVDSGATALVSHRGWEKSIGLEIRTVDLDKIQPGATRSFVQAPVESSAYATYTSGSTGSPKAVVVPHEAVANLLHSMAEAPGLSSSDTLLAVTTVSFDISVLELFLPLVAGARLVIASEDDARDGERLAHLLADRDVTVMQATPATWKLLLAAGWRGKEDLRAWCGGEALSRDLASALLERVSELWNMYGPTETTVWSTIDRVAPRGAISIGRPIANTTTLVLDAEGRVLPVGFAGELYLGGAGVAIGYLNRPDLTSERFVADPTGGAGRVYRTGDLVRRRSDGALEHLGRLDEQIKVRGFRIEAGEVEAALRSHALVRDAAVAARTGSGGKALVAWVVPEGDRAADVRELRGFLERSLPGYMIPTGWATLGALPLTANGKVDRRALRWTGDADQAVDLETARTRPSGAPRNAEEEVLVEIWQAVLERESVGVFDDFFALGGHSLLATMIVARIRSVLGVELPLHQLFARPTIAAAAEWVRSHGAPPATRPPLARRRDDAPAPLSFSQERMWFLQEMWPEGTAYNLAIATVVVGVFDPGRLARAFARLRERHAILRTRIATERGRPRQVVGPPEALEILSEDLSGLPPDEALSRGIALTAAELYRPYDLAVDPWLRVVRVDIAEDRTLVGIGMHHVAGDQGSFEIMIRELTDLYLDGPEAPSVALPIQYADFATWQRELLAGHLLDPALRYWTARLDGLTPLELPTDRPRPAVRGHAGDRVTQTIPGDVLETLRALGVEVRATRFMILLAAYSALLYARTRQTDLPIGVPTAHRDDESIEGLVGTFVNTLVHRHDLSGDPTFREIVTRVRETALEAFAHQELPFELLVRELDPPRDESRTPLFQVMFNLANVSVGGSGFPGLRTEAVRLPYPVAQVDLTMTAEINELRQEYQLNYSTQLFDRETAEAMLRQFAGIVERGARAPDTPLSELASAPTAERWLLLDEWNRTERLLEDDSHLLQALRERAVTDAGRTAVVGKSGAWSYQELVAVAAAVTARLRELGVSRGDRVGVMLDRDRILLACLLGIWGAGAAYVPMDPSYPDARLRIMLEDSGAVALVSRGAGPFTLPASVSVLDPSELGVEAIGEPDWGGAPDPDSAAYLIFTSGSTGRPKAVEVPHGAVMNFLRSMAAEPGVTERDTLLAVTTISFDISVLELFLPLLVGGRVVIATDEEVRDGRRLAERLDTAEATLLQATPSTWKLLISSGWAGRPGLKALCGGEALPPDLAPELHRRCVEVWNMYGPTETTVWSCLDRVVEGAPILIGRPIANTRCYVLDDQRMPVPVGVPGELFIGGKGVANGYAGQPDLTADRFVADPFREGERLYRTGDRVRYRRDGRLEHLGRLDEQVKVRGHRVELGEVEARLRSHDGLADAVVAVRGDRLIAYVRSLPKGAPTTGELRTWMSTELPAYMVPSLFVPLEELPRTPNGKVDRARLPDPGTSVTSTREHVPPNGSVEEAIAGVWRDLLGVSRIGANDNFFELGGHSLLAMEAVALVEERVGARLDPRELFFKSLRQLGAVAGAATP